MLAFCQFKLTYYKLTKAKKHLAILLRATLIMQMPPTNCALKVAEC